MASKCLRCAGTFRLDHAGYGMDPCDCFGAGPTAIGVDGGAADNEMCAVTLQSRDLTDIKILDVMKCRPSGVMTAVIRNVLVAEHGFRGLATSAVRTRLKRMERAGIVETVGSPFAVQLCWKARG